MARAATAVLKATAGTAIVFASAAWSLADAAWSRRPLSSAASRTTRLALQITRLARDDTRDEERRAAEPVRAAPHLLEEARGTVLLDPADGAKATTQTLPRDEPAKDGPWRRLRGAASSPAAMATFFGTTVVGAAGLLGVTETAMGAVAAFGAYWMARKRRVEARRTRG